MRTMLGLVLVAASMTVGIVEPSTRAASRGDTVEEIRRALLQLPYYGVFDFLAFGYDDETVTLAGYAYRATLKRHAEQAVRRVAGVDAVNNRVEALPVSFVDDDLRWRAYYAIYRDAFLSQYAPGGGELWGRRSPSRDPGPMTGGPGRFLGLEPAGDYPVHIIVKGGRILLLGAVASERDRTIAATRAREVPGAFDIDNQLEVDRTDARRTTRP
jgi:hyperosmotically inducible protein